MENLTIENRNEVIFDKANQLLDATNLNWLVTKRPLYAEIENVKIETESFGIFKGAKHLGTTKGRYVPFQNIELATTIIEACESLNIEVQRGGSLCNDRKIYLQAKLPSSIIGTGEIKRFVTALNTHDGSGSIGFGSANTVVICQNTFAMAYKEVSKFRHTTSAKERIKLAIEDLRKAMELDSNLMDNFKRMADIKLNEGDAIVQSVLNNMFKLSEVEKAADISTRKQNQINDFAGSLNKSIEEQGATVWALFNAVTRYTNHIAAPKDEAAKMNYLMDGTGYATALSSYETIMKWIDNNTAKQFAVTNY